jgi:hypothetical protein
VRRYLLLVPLLALVPLTGTTTSASADAGTVLPLQGFSRIIPDHAHSQLFITGSPGTDSAVLVVDETGAIVKTFTGEAGAGGMALSGTSLYVARCGPQLIDEIDTATLSVTDSFVAPGLDEDCDIAIAGGRLWYSDKWQQGHLRSVTLDASHTQHTTAGASYAGAMFAWSPSAPDTLVVAESGVAPTGVYVLDVSGAEPVLVTVEGNLGGSIRGIRDLALSADGTELFVTAGSPYGVLELPLADLTHVDALYPTGDSLSGIALFADETRIAAGLTSDGHRDLLAFAANDAVPIGAVALGSSANPHMFGRSVAFTADGSGLFSVRSESFGTKVVLHLSPADSLPSSSLTLSPTPAQVGVGGATELSGMLTLDAPFNPGSQTVHITATQPGGSPVEIGTAPTQSNGVFYYDVSDQFLHTGDDVVFGAQFTDPGYTASDATTTVRVGQPVPSIAVTVGATTITRGGGVKVTAVLGGWAVGRTVSIYRQPWSMTRVLVGSGTVGAGGTWSVTVKPGMRTTYTAQFDGDSTYLPATSTGRTVLVRANVGISQSGWYHSSGAYRLYHYRSGCWNSSKLCPHFAGRVTPADDNAKVTFTMQQHTSSGAWKTISTASFRQGGSGIAACYWRYRGTGWKGKLLRAHASYAGRTENGGNTSGWTYFRITS